MFKAFSIETDRLILRHWVTDDAADLYRYASDGRVSEMAQWPRHASVEMSREVIEKVFMPNSNCYAIELKESEAAVGCIGFVPQGAEHHRVEDGEREVGYWLGYPYWKKGLTTEALKAFVGFCRRRKLCKSLLITTDARNVASQRVAEKCGFVFVENYVLEGVDSKAYRLRLSKDLCDMTLEELWQLFPIILTPHQPQWKEWAKEEIESLSEILVTYTPIISHIGSTAIPAIQAKPIIDILVEIDPNVDWQSVKTKMETGGYICMSSSENRMSFNKGYTPDGYGEKVFHVHFHAIGDNDEILFRDYLNSHPASAREYEKLKLGLLPKYRNDSDGYTEAKSEFVKKVISEIKHNRS